MIFHATMTPALRIALRAARDEGTPDLLVLPAGADLSVERLNGSTLSRDEVDLCRLLCGGAAEKVS